MNLKPISYTLKRLIACLIVGLFLTNCNAGNEAIVNGTSEIPDTVLESPISQTAASESPLPTPTMTPRSAVTESFTLNQPIKVGDTAVSGTGPANVPIMIYEVANTADLLGRVTIPENGEFLITFERPLQTSERVGVVLDKEALANSPFEYEDFREIAELEVPVYGLILADVEVEP